MRDELLGESRWLSYLLIRLRPRTSLAAVSEVLQHAIDTNPGVQKIPPQVKERLVAKEIGAVILLSAAIALPLAALAIGWYLAPYSERTPFAFWSLAMALAAALATAAFAAARQAWVAMMLKPAVALRGP